MIAVHASATEPVRVEVDGQPVEVALVTPEGLLLASGTNLGSRAGNSWPTPSSAS